jgi:hypothetical protein
VARKRRGASAGATRQRIAGAGAPAVIPIVGGPDGNARRLASAMALATAPLSPMSRGGTVDNGGGNFFAGDPGFGVHRFAGKLARPLQTFTTPVRPIQVPKSIRVGMQAGPSSTPAFPSTGSTDGFGSLALMSGGALSGFFHGQA